MVLHALVEMRDKKIKTTVTRIINRNGKKEIYSVHFEKV